MAFDFDIKILLEYRADLSGQTANGTPRKKCKLSSVKSTRSPYLACVFESESRPGYGMLTMNWNNTDSPRLLYSSLSFQDVLDLSCSGRMWPWQCKGVRLWRAFFFLSFFRVFIYYMRNTLFTPRSDSKMSVCLRYLKDDGKLTTAFQLLCYSQVLFHEQWAHMKVMW